MIVYVVFAFRCFDCWLVAVDGVCASSFRVTVGISVLVVINSVVIYCVWVLWFLFIAVTPCFDCFGLMFVGYYALVDIAFWY